MKCKKCGQKHFTVATTALTEYHDANLHVVGSIINDQYCELEKKAEGSFYIWELSLVCTHCGEVYNIVHEGASCDDFLDERELEELYTEIERTL